MFKDAKEELERLENQLLCEDEAEDAPVVPCYNTDHTDVDLEALSDELNTPPSRNLTGLAIFFLLVTLAVVILAGCWLLRQRGVL